MNRPPRDRSNAASVDEATDTRDTIDWLLKNVPNTNGRVGMLGISYPGFLVNAAMVDPHPARYWKGFDRPTPIPRNTVVPFAVDLHQQTYTFKKGHRMMVHVQSTWFPLYDRNPQTFVPNIFLAKPSDYRVQTHRILRTVTQASHIDLSILPKD